MTTAHPTAADRPRPRGSQARMLAGRAAIYASGNFGVRALSFVLILLYTRFLTPKDYGRLSLAENISALALILAGAGLVPAFQRMYFTHVDQADELRGFVSSVLRFAIVVPALIAPLALIAGPWVLDRTIDNPALPFYPYVALAIVNACLGVIVQYRQSLFQVQAQSRRFALFSLAVFLLTVLPAASMVVLARAGAAGYLLGKFAGSIGAASLALVLLRGWLGARWNRRYVEETLRLSLPLMLNQVTFLGLELLDRFLLQRYRPLAEVGVYSLAYTIGMVMFMVAFSLLQAWSPMYYDLARDRDNWPMLSALVLRIVVLLAMVASFAAALAPDAVRLLLDPRYGGAAVVVPLIVGGYFLHGLFMYVQLASLQARRARPITIAAVTALIANITLNLLFIPTAGMYGAAYATLASFLLEVVLMYTFVRHDAVWAAARPRIAQSILLLGAVIATTQLHVATAPRVTITLGVLAVSVALLWRLGRFDLRVLRSPARIVRP